MKPRHAKQKRIEPFDSVEDMLAFDSRDWGARTNDAWLWGVVHGWPDDAYAELAPQHGWTPEHVAAQKQLHTAWLHAKATHAAVRGAETFTHTTTPTAHDKAAKPSTHTQKEQL